MEESLTEYTERIASRLHRRPEVSFAEHETTQLIREELTALGIPAVGLGLDTGVVARLAARGDGAVVGLRADIDALPLTEAAGRPDRSENAGVMHACGHDVHAAALLGAARLLSACRGRLQADVVFVFQPAEEVLLGAASLIAHGLFEKAPMDLLFGLHNAPWLAAGTVGVHTGALMSAKDDFTITVRGRGGHGGMPEQCADPIVAACGVMTALQTVVSRNVSAFDAAVVSVCSIHGGTADNLIVDEVTMTGSVRTMSESVRKTVLMRLSTIVRDVSSAYGCRGGLSAVHKAPALVNGEETAKLARFAAQKTVGAAGVADVAPCMASEDFAVYGARVPSFFYFLGCGAPGAENAPWHSARFAAAPGTAALGAELLKNSVLAAQDLL